MIDTKFVDDLVKRLSESIPPGMQAFKKDFERNFHSILMSAFAKMDLITREEFEVQKGVLAKTRSKIDALEKHLAALEAKQHGKTDKHRKGEKTKD